MSLSLIVLAGVSLAAGRILGDLWGVGPWLMIGFLLLAGLNLLGAFELPALGRLQPDRARSGARGALAAGGVLGLTLGPCTFAFFAPVLAFGVGPASLTLKFLVLGAFMAAHLGAIWAAGVLGARVAAWITRGGRLASPVKLTVGIGAIALAVVLIITTP
jgi:cytochrome c-type biogenesis protein